MSDYYPGEITIGGPIPRSLLPELQQQCRGISWGEYDGETLDDLSLEEFTAGLQAEGDPHLRLCDSQARNGAFEELEAWLIQHGLSFDRHSDAKYEYDAVNVSFRSGMSEPVYRGATQAGEDVFSFSELDPYVEQIEQAVENSPRAAIRKAVIRLRVLLAGPPYLPPLTLVEG